MKVGIIGVGAVGTACAKAMLLRGSCHEIVLIEKDDPQCQKRVEGVANDLSHGSVLCPPTRIRFGDYDDLADAAIVVITAGINEQAGKAIDPTDQRGRLLLLPHNAKIYEEIVPRLAAVAPHTIILVVTDPPDPLADVTCWRATETNPVISSGTFLDSLRFRFQLAKRLECHPSSVDALVIGEHGTSQVYVWSSARVGTEPVLAHLARMAQAANKNWDENSVRAEIEHDVKFANIKIIEGTGASQHGIGIVTARLVEAILRDEGLVAPVGVFQEQFNVTLSLPSIIGKSGVSRVLEPQLSPEETEGLRKSAAAIDEALDTVPGFKTGYMKRSK
ncbi:MAG: lactate dehydrogenase [Acidobacteriota bacterium]